MSTLWALAFCASALAQDPAAEAHKKYDAGDYHGAATAYAKEVSRSPRSAALHYNLGNSLYKAGRLGPAIASYQRAFDIRPRDPDIRYNLDFTLKKAGEELVPSGVPPLLWRAFTLLSERELAGLAWLACWAALLLASLMLHRPESRQAAAPWGAAVLALWLVCGTWWLARRGLQGGPRAVIVRPTAEVRGGPGENFPASFTAPEGRRVEILSEAAAAGTDGVWLEIGVFKEGAQGWIAADSVERIW